MIGERSMAYAWICCFGRAGGIQDALRCNQLTASRRRRRRRRWRQTAATCCARALHPEVLCSLAFALGLPGGVETLDRRRQDRKRGKRLRGLARSALKRAAVGAARMRARRVSARSQLDVSAQLNLPPGVFVAEGPM